MNSPILTSWYFYFVGFFGLESIFVKVFHSARFFFLFLLISALYAATAVISQLQDNEHKTYSFNAELKIKVHFRVIQEADGT